MDLCLAQPACPRFLATKLAKTFVCPEPPDEMISILAGRIRQEDFQLTPVLRELFSSQWFYAAENRRAVIKSPLELVLGTLRALTEPIRWPGVAKLLAELGQNVFEPPSVKGWEGGRLWISSASLLQRANFATEVATTDQYGPLSETLRRIAPEPGDVIVGTLRRWLLTESIDDAIEQELLAFYKNAEGTPEQKLRGLLQLILTLPESQLH